MEPRDRQGRAGPLAGTRLQMLPAIHTTWSLWSATHPDTVVLAKHWPAPTEPHRWESEFVLGVVVDDQALGLPFGDLERTPLAHVTVAGQPLLVVYVKTAATALAFGRQARGRVLTFRNLERDGAGWRMRDHATGTLWNAVTGEAMSGPLAGTQLPPVPATQAFLTAWRQLYPGGRLWHAPR